MNMEPTDLPVGAQNKKTDGFTLRSTKQKNRRIYPSVFGEVYMLFQVFSKELLHRPVEVKTVLLVVESMAFVILHHIFHDNAMGF
jgi:hypothetical protein